MKKIKKIGVFHLATRYDKQTFDSWQLQLSFVQHGAQQLQQVSVLFEQEVGADPIDVNSESVEGGLRHFTMFFCLLYRVQRFLKKKI